jgi:hypothetical protein
MTEMIGDGTILAGLFWLVMALAFLVVVIAASLLTVAAAWQGWNPFAQLQALWSRWRS